MRVERTVDIGVAPERLWRVLMDPHRLADWVTIHESLDAAPGELREGSTLDQCLRLAGRRVKVEWSVIEDARPERVVWEGRGPVRSRARAVYEVRPNGSGGSRFSYLNEFKLPGGLLGRLGGSAIAPISERESERSLARLKALLEGGG